MDRMPGTTRVIHSDPEILSGTPVFVGTRGPFQALLDYIEGGHPLAEFLDDFATVSREQAVAALEQAKELHECMRPSYTPRPPLNCDAKRRQLLRGQ